jgi:pimeloyl-ACP methyl ester carboxylesterase
MRPFFFGEPQEPLFGIYNPPSVEVRPKGAVVLCYPFGPEYQRSHRALRELAGQLADTGHHVLRFDYFGCGDSSGSTEQGAVDRWLEDIGRGVEELREASGRTRVTLLGLRFGATLAALAAARIPEVDRIVLWDPIVNGRGYLEELTRRNRSFMEGRPRPPAWSEKTPPEEVLGTPLPVRLRTGLEGVDLLALERLQARKALVLSTEPTPWLTPLCEHLGRLGLEVQHEHIPSPALWLKQDRVDRTLVPHQVLQRITSWLSGDAA